ncbi:MAG: hypothetical protein H0U54_04480, partial [Acidobacteria bacterium]|nr:hypothetical protein [Acidobacteriota bacterium]
MEASKSKLLRALPSVDALLRTETARALKVSVGAQHLTQLARAITDEMRAGFQAPSTEIAGNDSNHSRESLLNEAARRLELACRREAASGL